MNKSLFIYSFKKLIVTVFVLHIILNVFPMQANHGKLEEWERKVYSADIQQRLIELRSQQTPEEIKNIKIKWQNLMIRAYECLDQDPSSAKAQQIFTEWMALTNEEYRDYEDLKAAISLAYKNNQIPDAPFDQKLWDFLEKTAIHMYQQR